MPRGGSRTSTAGAEQVIPGPGPLPASSIDEAELLVRWLESPGVRLVDVEGSWSCPASGAARHAEAYAPETNGVRSQRLSDTDFTESQSGTR